ncbi:hypothetical protein GGI12_004365 [Dipsacomyces acuminosporus]|nr:hypothetical protein GGI12_004365 [Dipsacomyces acuminosporus]
MTSRILKSPYKNVDIPTVDLPSFFFSRVRQIPEFARSISPRPLFIDGAEGSAESLTLDQLEGLVDKLASGLYNRVGVRSGDVVAVVLPNSIYYTAILLSVMSLGASCTLANPAYTAHELGCQLSSSGSKFVITASALVPTIKSALGKQGASCVPDSSILVVDQDPDGGKNASIFSILDDGEYPSVHLTDLESAKSTVALIPYSSGTTGLPKGVLLSHYNLVANIVQIATIQRRYTNDKYPVTGTAMLPMFHIYGLVVQCFSSSVCGCSTVVMTKFEMLQFLSLVQTHHITNVFLVPPIMHSLAKLPIVKNYDLSSISWLSSSAAPLSSETYHQLGQQFQGVNIIQGYGMTEASPGISVADPARKSTSSSGTLLPNILAKVVDEQGKCLGVGQEGELCFSGPNVMMGYLNNEQATSNAIDDDGFLHTGDIGYIDDQRLVFVTARKKELIKFNGFQIAPAELEGILMGHPSVRDCAVVGIFDSKRQTEVPKAHLVLAGDDKLVKSATEPLDKIARQIVDWMNQQVVYYKQLRGGYAIVDSIPKSPAGKILRSLLK